MLELVDRNSLGLFDFLILSVQFGFTLLRIVITCLLISPLLSLLLTPYSNYSVLSNYYLLLTPITQSLEERRKICCRLIGMS